MPQGARLHPALACPHTNPSPPLPPPSLAANFFAKTDKPLATEELVKKDRQKQLEIRRAAAKTKVCVLVALHAAHTLRRCVCLVCGASVLHPQRTCVVLPHLVYLLIMSQPLVTTSIAELYGETDSLVLLRARAFSRSCHQVFK